MPDAETLFLLLGVFGPRSRPVRKVQRMLFWLPRFRHLDPHPLPPELPPAGLGTARLALRRIASDPAATVTVIQRPVPDTGEDEGSVQPFIVSSQSPEQRELLAQHDPSRPVFVEGPFPLWLRGTPLKYFVLRGDPLPPELRNPPPDPERSFYFPLRLELELERGPWDDDEFHVEPVEEGPVLGLCVAGAGDRRTLARWISALQELNPVLGRAPVVFRLAPNGDPHPDPHPDPSPDPQTPRLGTGNPPGAALEPPEGREGGGDPPKRRRRNVNCLRHAVIWYEDHRQRCPYEPRLAELDPSVGLYTTAVWQCERGHRYFQDLHSPLRPPSSGVPQLRYPHISPPGVQGRAGTPIGDPQKNPPKPPRELPAARMRAACTPLTSPPLAADVTRARRAMSAAERGPGGPGGPDPGGGRKARGRPRLTETDRARRRLESRKKYDVRRVYLGEAHGPWVELRRRSGWSDAKLAAYLLGLERGQRTGRRG
ncbi:PREDICTED: zinc finger protein 653 [Pseudopodoces humilis]|uniref:zinc finger protein 653 n=1 Tax=Pseudopodoces humilis TaxID=181119 RepID=UPI0006B6E5D5|nr:PREDICTED: zinc finger protein 653 [Pseudopodoces humilis]